MTRKPPIKRPTHCSHGHSLRERSSIIAWTTGGRTRWACRKCRQARYEPLHSRAARSGGTRRREWAAGLGAWGTYVWGGAFERDLKQAQADHEREERLDGMSAERYNWLHNAD